MEVTGASPPGHWNSYSATTLASEILQGPVPDHFNLCLPSHKDCKVGFFPFQMEAEIHRKVNLPPMPHFVAFLHSHRIQ